MSTPRYKALVDALAADIRAGRLPPGQRLPTHRALAARHSLALVTASRVYAELQALGLVSAETGRGTFVRALPLPPAQALDLPATPAGLVDLRFNRPAVPGQTGLLRAALRQLSAADDLEALLHYQPHAGRPHERALVATHLARQGLVVPPEQVALVDGAQHGLAVTLMGLLQPGDVVAIDALSYPGFKVLAATQRLELQPLPAAGQGPDPDALDRLCRRRRVRALYTMPTLHNPLGWVMSASRRRQLVALARRHDLLLIEDAAYAFLAQPAPAPLAALAPERTVHVSGLSKSVATGLRVGFVAAPLAWMPALERAIRATTWHTAGVMTALACGWLADGTVARLEHEKRVDAQQRQALADTLLQGLHSVRHPAASFRWLCLPPELRADQVAQQLQAAGVAVSTAEPFATTPQAPHALRLALGSAPPALLAQALRTVRQVLHEAGAV